MRELTELLYLFALGIPGWLIFQKLRLPSAAILGAMFSVGLCRIAGLGPTSTPSLLKPVLQIIIGLFIGLRVTRETPRALRGMVGVSLLVSIWWLATAVVAGRALHAVSNLDLSTALLGSTPGGVSEMALLALYFGAHASSVALLQFSRVVLVLVGVPTLGPWLYPLLERLSGRPTLRPMNQESGGGGGATARGEVAAGLADGGSDPASGGWARAAVSTHLPRLRTVLFGVAGGAVLEAAGFPAGGLVGSMLGVGAARALGVDCAWFPMNVQSLAQVGLGGIIGLSFTPEVLKSFVSLVLPSAVLTTIMLVNGFLLAVVVRRMTGWDIKTCVISTCAGGLTQMSAAADDFGANPITVTVLHVVRLITIVAALPPLFTALLGR